MNKTTLNSQKEKHSMLPLRRATGAACRLHPPWCHFYPRSPRGERLLAPAPVAILFGISIHALLAESDRERSARLLVQLLFLSTLSLRRATHESLHGRGLLPISIHALLTESDRGRNPGPRTSIISIHALLTESDIVKRCQRRASTNFSPRSPYGERRQTYPKI